MKKRILVLLSVLLNISLIACSANNASKTLSVGGQEYPEFFVKSGYYLDKASMSDATLGEMLSKIVTVEKPKNMGNVDLPKLADIKLVNNKVEEIDAAAIEAELEKERDAETTYNPIKIKREAKLTDKVKIDFKGYVDGEELEGGSGEDFDLVLGSGEFIPGFEDKIVGHQAGKRFNIDVVFPENYDEKLAGKPAKFEIVIKSIEEANTPEINEEFVKTHTKEGSTTVDEYKEEVKRKLEKRNTFLNNQNLIYQFTEYLYENTKFYPTEEALAWQFSMIIDQYNKQAEQMGMDFATMVTSNGGTIKDAYDEIKSTVQQAVQSTMLMDELQKKYNENVTEDDVKEWFSNMADSMGYGNQVTYEDYKKYMGYDNLKAGIEQERSLLKAIQNCNIVDEKADE